MVCKNNPFVSVDPVRPAAPYIGGKRALSKKLVGIIQDIPHTTYAEPFVGMGGVFLRRMLAARAEVVNDYSCDVATFFRVLQRHYAAFLEMMKFQLTTRKEFERLKDTNPDTLTDMERAARFLYLQRTTFGGKVAGRSFGVSPAHPGHFDITKLGPILEALHERLSGVIIECLPWEAFIKRYDRAETLFYLDPPYFGNERDYGDGMFGREEFEAMAACLRDIKGKFVLSINNTPEIREIFKDFDMEPVKLNYTVGGGKAIKPASELIITG